MESKEEDTKKMLIEFEEVTCDTLKTITQSIKDQYKFNKWVVILFVVRSSRIAVLDCTN